MAKLRLLFMMLLIALACGARADEAPATGNFILPYSQQPGPLIGFGQTVVNLHQTVISLYTTDFSGNNIDSIVLSPAMIYGLTNKLALMINLPVAAELKDEQQQSAGLEDTYIQLEYAFYQQQTNQYNNQATILGGANLPTGSSTQQPPTGLGAASFFVGSTYSSVGVYWFGFFAPGALLTTTAANDTQFGNQFFYQTGVGRNIMDIDQSWIIAWIVEADGQYNQKNKIDGVIDPNSGGNVIYVTPSLWFSSRRLTIQPGIGFPIVQHLFGQQRENHYLLAFNLSWTFY